MGEALIIHRGVDTSDATATAADILPGKTGYVNGIKLIGTATADATATAADIISGKTAYINGVKITGNRPLIYKWLVYNAVSSTSYTYESVYQAGPHSIPQTVYLTNGQIDSNGHYVRTGPAISNAGMTLGQLYTSDNTPNRAQHYASYDSGTWYDDYYYQATSTAHTTYSKGTTQYDNAYSENGSLYPLNDRNAADEKWYTRV